jgi:hypothetical protein
MQPGCSPSPAVTQDDDCRPHGGEELARPWSPPCPQLQGCSSSMLGRGVRRVGACLRVGSGSLLPSVIGGEGRSPSVALAAAACPAPGLSGSGAASGATSYRWGGARLPVRRSGVDRAVRGPATSRSSLRRRLHRGVAQHVVRREGGTRVLGQSRSCSCGEDESEDLPVRFWGGRHSPVRCWWVGGRCRWCRGGGRCRWCRGGGRHRRGFPLPKRLPPPTRPSVPPALRTSGSLALMAGSRPP